MNKIRGEEVTINSATTKTPAHVGSVEMIAVQDRSLSIVMFAVFAELDSVKFASSHRFQTILNICTSEPSYKNKATIERTHNVLSIWHFHEWEMSSLTIPSMSMVSMSSLALPIRCLSASPWDLLSVNS